MKTQNDLVRTKSFYCIHFTTALPDAIAMVPTNINEKEGRSYNRLLSLDMSYPPLLGESLIKSYLVAATGSGSDAPA